MINNTAWIYEVKTPRGIRYSYVTEGILIPGTANRCQVSWATKGYAKKRAEASGYIVKSGTCNLPNPTQEQRDAYINARQSAG